MTLEYKNCAAVVAYAANDIGLCIAQGLVSKDVGEIVLVDAHEADLEAAAKALRTVNPSINVKCIAADLNGPDGLSKLINSIKSCTELPIEMLFNNARFLHEPLVEKDEFITRLRSAIALNVTSAYELVFGLLDGMTSPAAIVNVSSVGAERAMVTEGACCISMAGLAQLTRSLAVELAPHGVRVNSIATGIVRMPMTTNAAATDGFGKLDRQLQRIPMGRPAEPNEVAAACLFLGSREASYITGASLAVDGGFLCT